MSGLIESVIGGIPVGTETVKLVWFYVAASNVDIVTKLVSRIAGQSGATYSHFEGAENFIHEN
jgi:hypothetical protein